MSVIEQVPIWLPGRGVVDARAARIDSAVQRYDERLRFGLNEANGQYAVFLKFPPGDPNFPELYPVLGFGFSMPEEHEVIEGLQRADSLRHGERILSEIEKRNAAHRAKLEEPIKAAEEEFVLAAESFLRNQGETKWSKSYPVKSKKGRRGK